MQAQIELLRILEAAFEEIGPINQFNVSVVGTVRIQLKFNWTQEDRLDVNYESHKRLIALLDGQRVVGQHVRAEAAEFAFKSTNKGRALKLITLIERLQEECAMRQVACVRRR